VTHEHSTAFVKTLKNFQRTQALPTYQSQIIFTNHGSVTNDHRLLLVWPRITNHSLLPSVTY